MKNLKITILIGIPASGKTSFAIDFIRNNADWVRVNRDSYRAMLKNQTICDYKVEELITKLSYAAVEASLLSGYNVILDNTHCQLKYLTQIVDRFKLIADIEFKHFDIDIDVAIERDSKRTNPVGSDVIKKMSLDLKNTLDIFNLQKVTKTESKKEYKNSEELESVVIFDIDNTLSHMNGKRGPFDWDKVELDDVDHIVADIAKNYYYSGKKVFLMTGRDESARIPTEKWLESNGINHNGLFMRKCGDFRKDTIVKKEIYNNEFLGKYWVEVIYDDRDGVVDMFRGLGIKVFQVEPGNF